MRARQQPLDRPTRSSSTPSNGDVGGLFTVGSGGDAKKPFTTNATGVATGLNADRVDGLDAAQVVAAARTKTGLDADTVDGKDATDLQARFAQVTAAGTAGETRGVPDRRRDARRGQRASTTVVFTGDLSKCALSATLTGADGRRGHRDARPSQRQHAVTVRTATSAGVAADRAFHLQASC